MVLCTSIVFTACHEQDALLPAPVVQSANGYSEEGDGARFAESDEVRAKRYHQSALVLAELLRQDPTLANRVERLALERVANGGDEQVLFAELLPESVNNVSFEQAFNRAIETREYPDSEGFADGRYLETLGALLADSVGVYCPYSEEGLAGVPFVGYASPGTEAEQATPAYRFEQDAWQTNVATESFATQSRTWIVQPADLNGISAMRPLQPTGTNGTNGTDTVVVFKVGRVKLEKQYDRWISFTGNGGGADLRFIRPEGFVSVNQTTGAVTGGANGFAQFGQTITRGNVNRKQWVDVNSPVDTDWLYTERNHVVGCYDEDTKGKRTFTGNLTLGYQPSGSSGITGNATFGFTHEVVTQDDIIFQIDFRRKSYLLSNKTDLGPGLQNGWTVYKQGQFFVTYPYQFIQ